MAGDDRCLFGIIHGYVKSSDFAPSCASPKIGAAILGEEGGGSFRHNSSFDPMFQGCQGTLRKP